MYICVSFVLILASFLKLSICDEESDKVMEKFKEGLDIATNITVDFFEMFRECVESSMPNQHFLTDDLQSFLNSPSRTTVGYAIKFTLNRKFFANLIQTTAFKEMVARDELELRKDLVKKLKYCDQSVMDQNLLKEFYDREVDQSKMK